LINQNRKATIEMDVFVPATGITLIGICIFTGILAWKLHPYALIVLVIMCGLAIFEQQDKKQE